MCNYFDNNVPTENLEKEFKKVFTIENEIVRAEQINGFAHDPLPIIQDDVIEEFVVGSWGISAPWIRSGDKKALLPLNARLETIEEKKNFKNNVSNRCVIPVNAFYEWRWLDPKGRSKEKNKISVAESSIFSLGAIYFIDKNGKLSFSICTTEANDLMSYIHNTKKRMPIILPLGKENSWLDPKNSLSEFTYPNYDPELKTVIVEDGFKEYIPTLF